ncbi:type VI secretion system baseplate subunit TssE [Nautilia lithotrophica]
MFKIRLLERLSKMEENPDFSGIVTNEEELESIFEYLKKILSTKEGSTLIAYDFGIPDISNYHEQSYGEYIRSLEEKLKNTIEKYEPRLKNIKVKYIDKYKDKSILTFLIEAQLAHNEKYPVTFETQIKSSGEVDIDEAKL